ncbi:hypothetical protein B0H14DRAFT_3689269 [Mycena olivaceomarginata]|nr:hypothetical protein B0H14DRAFT_3689269 [Mycena olivaceomarginata]
MSSDLPRVNGSYSAIPSIRLTSSYCLNVAFKPNPHTGFTSWDREVHNRKPHFTYSKGCDQSRVKGLWAQSYEETNVFDSAVLIMPLIFFIQLRDPRFVSTLKQILKTPEPSGLTANNLVFRYDDKSDNGVGGEEGMFCLCTLCIDAGQDFLLYLNHVGLCTEEISEAGEGYAVFFLNTEEFDFGAMFKYFAQSKMSSFSAAGCRIEVEDTAFDFQSRGILGTPARVPQHCPGGETYHQLDKPAQGPAVHKINLSDGLFPENLVDNFRREARMMSTQRGCPKERESARVGAKQKEYMDMETRGCKRPNLKPSPKTAKFEIDSPGTQFARTQCEEHVRTAPAVWL